MAPVDSAIRRLEWAEHHLKLLNDVLGPYIKDEPYGSRTEREPATQDLVVYAVHRKPIPPDVPLIAGDVIHSLRSSLDHLAWALARDRAKPGQVFFPIFKDELGRNSWDERHKILERVFAPDVLTALSDLQPYRTKYTKLADQDPLWILDQLWNHDKHRALAVIVASSHEASLRADAGLKGTEATPDVVKSRIAVQFGPLHDGKEILRVPANLQAEGEVRLEFTYQIAFEDGPAGGAPLDIRQILGLLHHHLAKEVFPAFAKFGGYTFNEV